MDDFFLKKNGCSNKTLFAKVGSGWNLATAYSFSKVAALDDLDG